VKLLASISLIFTAALAAPAQQALSNALWLDVPFVHQEENGCGSASLAMILGYWNAHGAHADVNAERIQRELYVQAESGIPAESLRGYLEKQGFRAIAFRGEWEDLTHHLTRGRPLMIALKTSGGTLHYAVAAGISADTIALNVPADRKLRKYSRAEFEKQWTATGRWTLLAVPGVQ